MLRSRKSPRRPHWWIVWNANIATHAQSSALALDRICVLTAHKHDLPRNRARLLLPGFTFVVSGHEAISNFTNLDDPIGCMVPAMEIEQGFCTNMQIV
ncbi:predicted protein [Brucella abortus]|uniref:Uncharacterized protein n=1 Tax=Brucella abortus (strain 2308) TaxID=359391 RepID=Q2YIZ6_BRUA2|nr:conserved hypothetical protein [Brucella abortus 2308]SHO32343.1 predicted protein [Brucella abortus]